MMLLPFYIQGITLKVSGVGTYFILWCIANALFSSWWCHACVGHMNCCNVAFPHTFILFCNHIKRRRIIVIKFHASMDSKGPIICTHYQYPTSVMHQFISMHVKNNLMIKHRYHHGTILHSTSYGLHLVY